MFAVLAKGGSRVHSGFRASKHCLRSPTMSHLLFIIVICCISTCNLVFSQEKSDLNSDQVYQDSIMLVAKIYKDKRTFNEIRQGNLLIRAAGAGDLDAIRKALKSGAGINSYYIDCFDAFGDDASGETALMWAVDGGHLDAVRLLIEEKADVNIESINVRRKGETALYRAVLNGKNSEIMDLLVKAGAKGNPKQIRLGIEMRCAACRGFKVKEGDGYPLYPGYAGVSKGATMAELLKEKADINAADPQGYTPLMYAANLGLVENVKFLLANGADANLKTRSGTTAFSLADKDSSCAREERQKVVELLKAFQNSKK